MSQLNLFDEPDKDPKNDRDELPPHFKTVGGGNIQAFLRQQYLSGYTGATFDKILKPKK